MTADSQSGRQSRDRDRHERFLLLLVVVNESGAICGLGFALPFTPTGRTGGFELVTISVGRTWNSQKCDTRC